MAVTFISKVDVTPASGAYYDIDVSSYVSANATGVILHVINTSTTSSIMFRKNGSTDDRYVGMYSYTHTWIMIGLDENFIFEAKIGATTIKVYLIGYTEEEAVYFTNAINKSIGTISTWVDVDVSANTGADTAIGVIIEQYSGNSALYYCGVRPNGATGWEPPVRTASHYCFTAVVGVDANEIYETYIASTELDHYLVGYFTSGVYFFTGISSPYEPSVSIRSSAWHDLRFFWRGISEDFNADATGVILQIFNQGIGSYAYGIRSDGDVDDDYYDVYRQAYSILATGDGGGLERRFEAYNPQVDPYWAQYRLVGLFGVDTSYIKTGSQVGFDVPRSLPSTVFRYDSSLDSYTDLTTASGNYDNGGNSAGGDAINVDVQVFPSSVGDGDRLMVGLTQPFSYIANWVTIIGVGTYTNKLQYYNGSDWVDLTVVESRQDGDFKILGWHYQRFNMPPDWVSATINGVNRYWVSITYNGGTMTTVPVLGIIYLGTYNKTVNSINYGINI